MLLPVFSPLSDAGICSIGESFVFGKLAALDGKRRQLFVRLVADFFPDISDPA